MRRHLRSAAFALVLMAGIASAQERPPTSSAPEPALLALVAVGAGGLAWRAYKKKRKQ
jgi:hypothetical protein